MLTAYVCVCVCAHVFYLEGTAQTLLSGCHFYVPFWHVHAGAPLGLRFGDYVSGTWGHPDHNHEQENLKQPGINPIVEYQKSVKINGAACKTIT